MSLSKDSDLSVDGADKLASETVMAAELESEETEMTMVLSEENATRLLEVEDLQELLEKLTSADAMAEGMESKLDSLLEDLDNLLSTLDSAGKEAPRDDTSISESEGRSPSK